MFPQNTDLGNGLSLIRKRNETVIMCNKTPVIIVPNARRKGIRKTPAFKSLSDFVQECAEIIAHNERLLA